MSSPHEPAGGDRHRTEPIEYQRYGPARDEEPRLASWQAGSGWRAPDAETDATPPAAAPRERGRAGVASVIAIALITGVASGSLSALAVTNLARPAQSDQAEEAAPDEPDAVEASSVRIDESSAVISATERVGPAVVTISAREDDLFGGDGVGSGFIYDPAGWIVTNRHVVEDAEEILVILQDSREFEGSVVGVDTLTDLAIVKIRGTDLPAAPIGTSEGLKVGQLAIAIGSPLGNYQNSVTSGVVSGLGRQIRAGDVSGTTSELLNNLIQTDAAINLGNSGGPLINSAGQVIGVNTAVATAAQGIGFAIPIDIARPIMDQARRGEELTRPWIGIYYLQVNAQLREERNLPVSNGVIISAPEGSEAPAVFPDSPAERAGLQEGDVIVAIDGVTIDREHDLSMLVLRREPGDTIKLRVVRGDTEREIRVTLGVMPDQTE